MANNARFLILPGRSEPNLASRVLSLSLRRLSADMGAAHGHPALLAETFADPARFAGTSYGAAGWEKVGLSKGYERPSETRRPFRLDSRANRQAHPAQCADFGKALAAELQLLTLQLLTVWSALCSDSDCKVTQVFRQCRGTC